MNEATRHPKAQQTLSLQPLVVLRHLSLGGGLTYLVWYFTVDWLFPAAFNPLLSRLGVVACFLGLWGASYVDARVRRHFPQLFLGCLLIMTTHYFYLFHFNQADINWVVGCYITLTAGCACMLQPRHLVIYSIYSCALSVALVAADRTLLRSIFLPGVLTVITFANLGMRLRLRLLAQVNSAAQHLQQLWAAAQAGEENRILYESTHRALQLREEYISIIAHELKTPLTAARLRSQMMQRSSAAWDVEKMRSLAAHVDAQLQRLTVLVEDMLDVSRISSGKLVMRMQQVDLTRLVEETVRSFEETHDLRCELNVSAGVTLHADPYRIEQVLLNLLTNAQKYGQDSLIEVSLACHQECATLAVRDHGRGISPADRERIFARFERAVEAREVSGLGLGLFICREIVQAHGGRVGVDPTVDAGARFEVELPLHGAPQEP